MGSLGENIRNGSADLVLPWYAVEFDNAPEGERIFPSMDGWAVSTRRRSASPLLLASRHIVRLNRTPGHESAGTDR